MFIVPVKVGRYESVEGVEVVSMDVNINFYYGNATEYLDSKIFLKNKKKNSLEREP